MWCIPELTPEYIERMEDILDLYQLPYNEAEPVICIDEKPVQLLGEKKSPIPAQKPGEILKPDYEYIRCGTANVFCIVEPKGGNHFTYVTKNKKGPEFAKVLYRISKKYSLEDTIHLVMDNYSTHTKKSLTDFYGEEKGTEIWNRYTIHYTPVHASWLDQAEIEIGIYSSQCLGKRRISTIEQLKKETTAWNAAVNRKKLKISWNFTTKKARKKFKYSSIIE
jgi:hypothetical protein